MAPTGVVSSLLTEGAKGLAVGRSPTARDGAAHEPRPPRCRESVPQVDRLRSVTEGSNSKESTPAWFAIVDVETTGLSPTECRIVELGVVLSDRDGTPIWEWSTRLNPEGPVGPTHIHGIRQQDVAGAPLFGQIIPFLNSVLAQRVIVAHNATFDLAFLHSEYLRAGWELPLTKDDCVCTLAASHTYLPELGRWRLADCAAALGIQHTEAHTALGDARSAAGLLRSFLTRTADRGALLEWELASTIAARTMWPTGPTKDPIIAVVGSSKSPQRWDRKPPVQASALVSLLDELDLAAALDEGAPEGCLSYLELLATCLEDEVLTTEEATALTAHAHDHNLSAEDVDASHTAFMSVLAQAAMLDGKVTRGEKHELVEVAHLLGVDDRLIPGLVAKAEAAREAHLSAGLLALPPDWSLGEPLRVGDKVVFTGCDPDERELLEGRAEMLGVRVISGMSRRIIMLVSDGTMNGNKYVEAQQLNTRMVHPKDFIILLDHLQPALVADKKIPQPVPKKEPIVTVLGPGPAIIAAAFRVNPGAVRAWAATQGIAVGERGRISSDILSAYERAQLASS